MKRLALLAVLASSPAFALLPADITHDTDCGAPGVGYEGIRSSGTERLVQKQQPGLRVSGNGWWVACKMPPACAEKKVSTWDSLDGRARCAGISSIRAGKLGDKRTVIDWATPQSPAYGRQTWQCTSVGWTLIDAYCR